MLTISDMYQQGTLIPVERAKQISEQLTREDDEFDYKPKYMDAKVTVIEVYARVTGEKVGEI